MASQIDGFVCC